ncbi:MAG: hypothetical protein ACR2GD_04795, partial [Pyrinomonadaceae bacterium]
ISDLSAPMTKVKIENQPTLFEPRAIDGKEILLYALGEFQSRGKILAERELALDRLRGAFRRAAEKFQAAELTDETIVELLEKLGTKVVRKPSFVAKHPFRVTVHSELAEKARIVFAEISNDE